MYTVMALSLNFHLKQLLSPVPFDVQKTLSNTNESSSEGVHGSRAGGLFDPLNLVDGQDEARQFRLKEAELKHGRLAMVAFAGDALCPACI